MSDQTMLVPFIDGDKQLCNFKSFFAKENNKNSIISSSKFGRYTIMYDQEPLLPGVSDAYKHNWSFAVDYSLHDKIYTMDDALALALTIRTTSFPIWCTSEFQSVDIAQLTRYKFIPCYYWYHAFISRDWFRHWQYHDSLSVQDKSDSQYRFLLYSRATSGTREYRKDLIDRLRPFSTHICYDWAGSRHIGSEHSAVIDVPDARCSAIHLVAETLFDTDKMYLTEKVFKPMVMSQPFLIFGPPGTLKCLKRYGFKTFDHAWDESYDEIMDSQQRLQILCDIVKHLAGMSASEFSSIYARCLPVIDHNRRHFFSAEFMDLCWKELNTNWRTACEQRDQLERDYPWGQTITAFCETEGLEKIPLFSQIIKNLLRQIDPKASSMVAECYKKISAL